MVLVLVIIQVSKLSSWSLPYYLYFWLWTVITFLWKYLKAAARLTVMSHVVVLQCFYVWNGTCFSHYPGIKTILMIITLLSVFLTLNSYNFSLKISQSCCKAYCYVPCRSFTVFLCLLPGRTLNEVTFNFFCTLTKLWHWQFQRLKK